VQCNYPNCKKIYKLDIDSNNYSNIYKHKHIKKLRENEKKNRNSTINIIGTKKKEIIDLKLLHVIAEDNRPINMIITNAFQDFIHSLNSSYSTPHRDTIYRKLGKEFLNVKNNLKLELKNMLYGCITSDMCLSSNKHHFLILTLHYINNFFNLNNRIIALQEVDEYKITGEVLKKKILGILDEYGITDKIICGTSDAGPNIKWAFDNLKDDFNNFHCFAHKLNLIVKESIKIVEPLLVKCKSIVRYFNQSVKAHQLLKQIQKEDNFNYGFDEIYYELINDVVTRFNSTYFMVKRIQLISDNINECLDTLKQQDLILSEEELDDLDDLVSILEPFNEITIFLSGSDYPTFNIILPSLAALIKKVETMIIDSDNIKNIKDYLLIESKELFDKYLRNDIAIISTFLDPNYKHLLFIEDKTQKNKIFEKIRKMIKVKE